MITAEARTEICLKIQETKRRRDVVLKSRIMMKNQLASNAATILGYRTGMSQKDRKKHWDYAEAMVGLILKGKSPEEEIPEDKMTIINFLVIECSRPITAFTKQSKMYEKHMMKMAEKLSVCEWLTKFRGFTSLALANMIGETGDLSNYANPAKVWKRMGCAPFEKNGEVHTGQGWGINKGLTSADWEEFGYCPRRRSVMHIIAANVIKTCAGKNGHHGEKHPFYQRYLEAKKVAAAAHPDWTPGHVNSHGLLLCGKRVLRELWIEWNK